MSFHEYIEEESLYSDKPKEEEFENYFSEDTTEKDDDQDLPNNEDSQEENDEYEQQTLVITYICEDCDYRWDSKQEFTYDDHYDQHESHEYCPMCGSASTIHLQ